MGRFKAALLCCIALALASAQVARAQSVEPRIVGGSGATVQQYPWQAALVISPAKASGNPHQRQICGGSLITTSIVLTAAHCLYDTDPDCNQFGAQDVCVPGDPNGDGTKQADPDDVDVVLGGGIFRNDDPAFHAVLRGRHVETIHSREASLDDVFVEVTGRQLL